MAYSNSSVSFFIPTMSIQCFACHARHCQFKSTSSICQAFIYPDGERFERPEEQDRNCSNQCIYRLVVDWCRHFFSVVLACFGHLFGGMKSFCAGLGLSSADWITWGMLTQETYIRTWCVDRAKMDPARESLTFRWYEDRALRSDDIST